MSHRCVLFGAGEYSNASYQYVQGDYIIAADGGYSYLKEQDIVPDILIGDMDSFPVERFTGEESFPFISLPTHKDDTDMLAAIRLGLSKGYTDFALYGALGGRLDHTLANLQCLQFLREHGAGGTIYGEENTIFLMSEEKRYYSEKQQGRMSLFAFTPVIESVTLTGFEYELNQAVVKNSYPIGISNSFCGKPSTIEIHGGTALIIIQKNE